MCTSNNYILAVVRKKSTFEEYTSNSWMVLFLKSAKISFVKLYSQVLQQIRAIDLSF